MSGLGLVDGVVHHFPDHVMKTGNVIDVTDVHPGALTHRVPSLEDLDVFGGVARSVMGVSAS